MSYDTESFSTRRRVTARAVDRVNEQDFQRVKLVLGEEGETLVLNEDNPLPVAVISGGGGGGGGGGTEYAEDAAHANGDLGTMALAVRQDANTSLVGTNGDYAPLQVDNVGSLKVAIISGAGSGGTASTDDAAFTAAVGSGTPIMGFVTSDSVDSGDVGVVGMTATRDLKVSVQNATLPVTDAGGSLTVDGTVAISGTVAVTDNAGSLTVDGTIAATQSGAWSLSANQSVNTSQINGVTPLMGNGASGTGAQRVTIANDSTGVLASIGSITTSVTPGTGASNLGKAEDAAHTSADVGVMALAVRRDADTTLVDTTGDYAPLQVNAAGSLKVAITSGAGSGGTSAADGSTFTRTSTSLTPAGAVVETSAPTLTNGQVAGLSQTTGGALRVAVASGGITGIAEDAVAADGVEGIAVMAVRRDSATSGVSADGDYAMLSVTSDGSLRVSGSAGTTQYAEDAASAGAESLCLAGAVRQDTIASSTTTDGDYSHVKVNSVGSLYTSLSHMGATAVSTGNGTTGAGSQRVTIASDNTAFSVNAQGTAAQDAAIAGNPVPQGYRASSATPTAMSADGDIVYAWATRNGATVVAGELQDDNAFSVGATRVVPPGLMADEASTDSVDEGDVGVPRMTLDRKTIVTPYVHAAAGGTTPYSALSTAAVLTAAVKASPGKVYSITCFNLNAAARFVRLYNMTTAPASTDGANIVWRGIIPGATTGAGFTVMLNGMQFTTGIGIRASTGIADNDTGALAANELTFNVEYA